MKVASPSGYVGRFAPSPTGPLHAGSLVAALASRLDALAHHGRWLLRIEDLDPPREAPGARAAIIEQLRAHGFVADGEVVLQSQRHACYEAAFARLQPLGVIYPCCCTRREIADALQLQGMARERHDELVYPGTCRHGMAPGRTARAWRVRVDGAIVDWYDRGRREWFNEPLAERVGDFVLRRADGLWAYQLAVVVDDHLQGVTEVVRGDDLIGSTARQIHLQQLLGIARPGYLHVPVVTDQQGEKLSKQTGAAALDADCALASLEQALQHLELPATGAPTLEDFWSRAVEQWRGSRWMPKT
jgi:glutamyl-Q tRNA(Asp) synthetase